MPELDAVHHQPALGVARGGDRSRVQRNPGNALAALPRIGDLHPSIPTAAGHLDLATEVHHYAGRTLRQRRRGGLAEGDTFGETPLLDTETGGGAGADSQSEDEMIETGRCAGHRQLGIGRRSPPPPEIPRCHETGDTRVESAAGRRPPAAHLAQVRLELWGEADLDPGSGLVEPAQLRALAPGGKPALDRIDRVEEGL